MNTNEKHLSLPRSSIKSISLSLVSRLTAVHCVAAWLTFSLIAPLQGEIIYVSGEGRVSEINAATGQRKVFSGWNLNSGGLIAIDPVSGDIFVADQGDRAVYRVNKNSGMPTLISGPGVGSGPLLSKWLSGIAVGQDGSVVVVDGYDNGGSVGGLCGIFRIDPATGQRIILSAGSNSLMPRGVGVNFGVPFGIAIEASGHLLVTDSRLGSVIRVDRQSGNRITVSGDPFGDNVGTGPAFRSPKKLVIENSNSIVVLDNYDSTRVPNFLRVNLNSGDRMLINDFETSGSDVMGFDLSRDGLFIFSYTPTINYRPLHGVLVIGDSSTNAPRSITGFEWSIPSPYNCDDLTESAYIVCSAFYDYPWHQAHPESVQITWMFKPLDVACETNGDVIVSDVGFRDLVRINITNKIHTLLPNSRAGNGKDIYNPSGMAVDPTGRVFVADKGNTSLAPGQQTEPLILSIDPVTRERTVVSAGSNTSVQRGSGSNMDQLHGMALESTGFLLVVETGTNPRLLRIDPGSGDRKILSNASYGSGPLLVDPFGVAVAADDAIVLTDSSIRAILAVDPLTGNRTLLSSSAVGSGPAFSWPRGITVLKDGTIAVTDGNLACVFLVNRSTGRRVILSSANIGGGTGFESPCGIVETKQGDLLVVDQNSVVKVSRSTGNRTIVAGATSGSGPYIGDSPEFLVIAPPFELTMPLLVNGTVQFNLLLPLGQHYLIEVSTNLTTWKPLTGIITTSSTTNLIDTGVVSQNAKFYRARIEP